MPLVNEKLYRMIGRVRSIKPNAKPESIRTWINDAIRDVINTRTYWADLLVTGIISVPNLYNTGTISTVTGSPLILGGGTTFFPVSDVVNTTLQVSVTEPGYLEVTPASMTGIVEDGSLLVDTVGSGIQEAVPILRTTPSTFTGKFQYAHPLGVPATQSSLVGRQWRAGYDYPIFTVIAVIDANTLMLDNPWGGPPLNSAKYWVYQIYYTLDSKIRKLLDAVDQQQGWPLDLLTYTHTTLNTIDPQRSDQSDPRALVPFRPTFSGNQQWELYPAPDCARQIAYLYSKQWPELLDDNDVPPSFLEPTIFTNLAASAALRTKISEKDPWYLPNEAMTYEKLAAAQLMNATGADEDRQVRDYQNIRQSLLGSRSFNWYQSHALGADSFADF
jgi:hypothetical protein